MGLSDSLYAPLERYHRAQDNGAVIAGTKAGADSVLLARQVMRNENVDTFIEKITAGNTGGKPSPGASQLTDAIIKKWKQEGPGGGEEFIKALNKDLADPKVAAKLEAAMKANPAAVAAALPRYAPGNLDSIIPAAAAAPVAPAPSAAPATKPAAAPAKVDPELARRGRPAPAAAPAEPPKPAGTQAPAKPDPITVTAEPAGGTAVPATKTGPSDKELTRDIIKDLAKDNDENIKASINPKFVQRLADGLADFGSDKFPELKDDAQGFRDKIKASPALQKQIADNLRENPQLIRDLAEAMDSKDTGKGIVGSAVKGKLKEIYSNPNVLADKDYTNTLSSQLAMAKGGTMGGIGNWMKSNLGIDLNGIGAGIGGLLQGIMNWFGKFFNSFSSGNFALMGNLNPKMGMFDKLNASMERAERASQLRGYEEVIPRNGAKGSIGDGIERDAQGKPVMETKTSPTGEVSQNAKYNPENDHRITVGGHKFYLTDKLQPQPQRNGQVIWTVATEVNNVGQATAMTEIVLSKEDSDKLYKRMQEAAQARGKPLQIQDPSTAQIAPQPASNTNVSQYNSKTGEAMYRPQPGDPGYVAPVYANTEPRPGDPRQPDAVPPGTELRAPAPPSTAG